ncbi:MAG: dephospho-CoA kinase [Anaerolineae bacterium]
MADKVVIGLTGNIATGKSLVMRMLQELGAAGIDADKLAHETMSAGSPVHGAIVEEFGRFILDANGQIDRNKLGRIAFAIPEAMTRLEGITHPAVRQEIMKRINQAQAPVVVVEAIKLFETGLKEQCQAVWVVAAPPEVQLRRLVERRKMSPELAQQRIKAQSSQAEKAAKADVVIDNSGELAKTWAVVKKHYTALTGKAQPVVAEPAPASAPAKPAGDIQVGEVTLRRAKRPDLETMAQLIAAGTKGAINPDLNQMMELLFTRAYVLAVAGSHIVGIAGWQTENLIAGLQDFYVLREDLWPKVGAQMLEMIHEEVNKLSCEVSIAFVMKAAGSKPVEFFESQGYEQAQSKDLGYIWKDAAAEWQPENSVLLYKKLREQRIMVPM